jgi:predicted HAD superfamily phosphohydrolase YqeG
VEELRNMRGFKGVIFDLDETLVDTRMLASYREKQNWSLCYDNVRHTSLYENVDVLLK